MKPWNKNYTECIVCKKTDSKHKGLGMCLKCYNSGENRKKIAARWKASNKGRFWYHKYDQELKRIAIDYYSKGKNCCAVCGFSDSRALTIDHIDNNGHAHRKTFSTTINAWLRTHKYPEGFQVLCCNCNWIKEVERRKLSSSYYNNE